MERLESRGRAPSVAEEIDASMPLRSLPNSTCAERCVHGRNDR